MWQFMLFFMFFGEKMGTPSEPPPYSGPPPSYGAPPPVQVTPVVTTTYIVPGTTTHGIPVVVGQQMGSKPAVMSCRSCGSQIETRIERKAVTKTHLFALLLCLIGCWPCVCVPYCMDSCNSVDHYCPNCNAYIGSYLN